MLYKYKGLDQNGKTAKGTLTANSVEEAKQKLRTQNIYYQSLEETKQLSMEAFSKRVMPGTLLSSMSKELSSYLNSGMTILTALKLMDNQHE
jgi:general secretion pathway protein F/type IV pilus assembly protein PilC